MFKDYNGFIFTESMIDKLINLGLQLLNTLKNYGLDMAFIPMKELAKRYPYSIILNTNAINAILKPFGSSVFLEQPFIFFILVYGVILFSFISLVSLITSVIKSTIFKI